MSLILQEIKEQLHELNKNVSIMHVKLESHISEHQAQSRTWKTVVTIITTLIGAGGLAIACIK